MWSSVCARISINRDVSVIKVRAPLPLVIPARGDSGAHAGDHRESGAAQQTAEEKLRVWSRDASQECEF